MATDRRAWTAERTWTIKGVSDRTRAATLEAAHEAQLTVGEWVEQVLARAAEEARHPRPPALTREEVASLLDERLKPIAAALGQMAERRASFEGKTGREIRPEPVSGTAAPPPPPEAEEISERPAAGLERALAPRKAPGRRLPEEVRARIEELHRAGRSAYAISKELGVSYTTVHNRVKALKARE
jgi:hypothetical protein